MEPDDLLTKFTKLKVKRKGGQAAFHKPLLALWAIGRCLRREPRLAPFAVVDQELEKLLRRFGPAGQSLHTQEPFWRLKNDGVWEVRDEERVPLHPDGASGYRAYRKDLLRLGIQGGLKQEVYEAFARNPELARRVAQAMLAKYLPNESSRRNHRRGGPGAVPPELAGRRATGGSPPALPNPAGLEAQGRTDAP